MKNYIGIDLGGTNVRVAKITENGDVLQEIKSQSYGLEGPGVVVPNIIKIIKEIGGYKEVSGIGIGVPGPVDTINGIMKMSTNLTGFTDYPLAKTISEELNIPTYIDNDANVAGLAEALVGAGKDKPVVYYATISTGIGGALIVNGKVVSGRNGYAGEIGNIIVKDNGDKVNALNPGAVENEASGTALTRKAKKLYPENTINSALDIFERARKKDPIALELCKQMSKDIARVFSTIAHVVDPDIFVIGGGVMNASDVFLEDMKKEYNNLVHIGMRDPIFTRAKLDEPGIIGAAMLPRSMGE